jgi:hypothetical protein
MLAHDPLIYRSLLLRLAQTGTTVLPMGALRFLAAYARSARLRSLRILYVVARCRLCVSSCCLRGRYCRCWPPPPPALLLHTHVHMCMCTSDRL